MSVLIRGPRARAPGLSHIADLRGEMKMDFDVLILGKGKTYRDDRELEKACLLVAGEVRFDYDGKTYAQARSNCFDEPPTALHVSKSTAVTLTALSETCEIDILRTDNGRDFESRLYLPGDTPDEFRGAGLMHGTSTRIVRTIFDYRNAPYANLVLGEVIGFPGKWSSYPPHHHPQPEIYYYKTNPENGFAYAETGDTVHKVHNNDTVFISPGDTHPQCTPPGYALWYLWAIRHLEGNPYGTPTFVPEYLWVQEKNAVYWGDDQ